MRLTMNHASHIEGIREALRRWGWPPALPREQAKSEIRWTTFALTFFFFVHLLEPAAYALAVDSSILSKVVALTHKSELVLALLYVCAFAVVPHLVSLALLPRLLHCRLPRQLACAGTCGAGVMWAYLGTLSIPLDAGPLWAIYWARGFVDVGVGLIFAISLNSQQLRPYVENETRAPG